MKPLGRVLSYTICHRQSAQKFRALISAGSFQPKSSTGWQSCWSNGKSCSLEIRLSLLTNISPLQPDSVNLKYIRLPRITPNIQKSFNYTTTRNTRQKSINGTLMSPGAKNPLWDRFFSHERSQKWLVIHYSPIWNSPTKTGKRHKE